MAGEDCRSAGIDYARLAPIEYPRTTRKSATNALHRISLSLEHWSSNMTRRLVQFAAGVALIAAVTLPGIARADNQDVIDYREHIMKTLGETAQSLTMIMQGKAPAENFAVH